MKPRTRIQKEIAQLSKRLPKLSKAQRAYAFEHCFKHYAHRTKKGIITCLECGHQWKSEHHLAESICGCTCPHCGKQLEMLDTRKRVFREMEYFCIITTCKQYQVLRYFSTKMYRKVGQSAEYSIKEVVQRWIAPNGKTETIARLRCMSIFYYDVWNLYSDMEIRTNNQHRAYDINPYCTYPKMRIIPELKRNGFNGSLHNLSPFDLFTAILKNSKQETLLKAGQIAVLRYSINTYFKLEEYWASIKICIRNGYTITDASMWKDYIDLLRYFGKDSNNPKYVCPTDLQAEHDRLMDKKNQIMEKEREQQRIRMAQRRIEAERQKAERLERAKTEYALKKANFLDLNITDGFIFISVLQNVEDFYEEGKAMHHCVYSNEYYNRDNSLILSARIDGKRVETIEVNLENLSIIQSRGACNQDTEYHDRIVSLVNKNMKLIRKRMAA